MALDYNTDYLKFDAFSIKNAIVQNLSKDKNFTDQIFESSNLIAMIDTFSVLFEYLMYYTNHGASEAIFTDTTLYENINRIVKMLGYNPLGHISSKTTISFQNASDYSGVSIFTGTDAQKEVSKYSYMDTGLTDTKGNPIYYSPIRNFQISDINEASENNVFTAINGRWRLYERTFISNGDPFEEYTLNSLLLDSEDENADINYVAHPYIDVYVKTTDPNTGEIVYDLYESVPDGNIFGNNISILKPQSQKFELRINENKNYVIKFGDGIHGKKLQSGDEIYVVYLEGNGNDSSIGVNIINDEGILTQGIAGATDALFYAFQGITKDDIITQDELNKVLFNNITESTSFTLLEDVDSIRENAPVWFRSGGHLITRDDYKNFIISRYSEDIYSAKIMNNYEYMANFYKWLHTYNSFSIQIRNYEYIYADACDFNNIYIWIKPKYTDLNKQYILDSMNSRKTLTSEPFIINALDVIFVPCLNFNTNQNLPIGYTNLKYDINDWDTNYENWIEIHKDIDSTVSTEKIRSIALREIKKFFNPLYNTIGIELNLNNLYTRLLSISGVKQVRTAYKPTSGGSDDIIYYNGLSFAKWTPLIVGGKDVDIARGILKLENFQFPVLLEENLESRVKVVSESFNQTSIEY